ncbi:hypothetical protein [Methylocystis bryophila]|nr:hypothetical protein [Methylocystis bryophila]
MRLVQLLRWSTAISLFLCGLALFIAGAFAGSYAPLPPGCTASACVTGEYLLAQWPTLMADLVAQNASGSSTYADQMLDAGKSAASYSWSTSAAPTLTSNADGLTGINAWSFDGATANNVKANFSGPNGEQIWPITGDFTLAVVADLSASAPTTGTTVYALAGSGLTAANGWVVGVNQRKICVKYTGATSCTITGASALSTGTPHLIILSWSSVDQLLAVSIDGGAWQTASTASVILSGGTLTDATLWIGNSASSSYAPWWGNVFRALLLKEALQNSAKAGQLAFLQTILAAKY